MNNPIIPFYKPTNKVIVKSEGCYQYDSEDKKYIDLDSGVWCTNLGHSHPDINRVIEFQIKESIHHGYKFRNELSEQLSTILLQKFGMENGASVFLSSGSESVNLAITLAKHLTRRDKILKIDNTYLSAYGHGRISDENNDVLSIAIDDFDSIKKIDFEKIAAFVFEPGTSFGFIKFPTNEFIKAIDNEIKKHGCLFIVDEVTTGFGRTGKWFGYHHYNIAPDIVAAGKSLGNGYPVSVVSITEQILNGFNAKPFRYAQSHQNDPLGCAIALEVINVIEKTDLLKEVEEKGLYFKNKLIELQKNHSEKIKEIRARGFMLAIEFFIPTDAENLHEQLFEHGFITGYKANIIRFMPPLTIQIADIDSLTNTINQLINQ